MTRTSIPMESAEAFGRLCAALDDPFAERAVVLAEAGLTEASYASLQERWIARLSAENGGVLAADLERGFRAGREGAAQGAGKREDPSPAVERPAEAPSAPGGPSAASPVLEPAPLDLPTFMQERSVPVPGQPQGLSVPAQGLSVPAPEPPALSASAAPALVDRSTETRELDISKLVGPAVPFRRDAGGGEAVAPSLPSSPVERPARDGETVDVDVGAIARRVLAFGPPGEKKPATAALSVQPAAAPGTGSAAGLPAAPPGKRWRRFDPQTGQPLPEPVLEDVPAGPAPAPAQEKQPGYHAETAELDPALVAAALRKGASPFRR